MIVQPSNVDQLRAAWRAVTDGADEGQATIDPAPDQTGARVYVQGMIGGWRMDAGKFVQAVHDLQVPRIDVHINSRGGFVWDAVSMYEALLHHPATVHTHIDGLAASAASFLALAGDRVDIAQAGRVMIHDVQAVGYGSPADLREAADLADQISNDIAGIYADRAGGTVKSWRAAMTATTWYSSQQAVDAKLAHRIAGSKASGTGSSNRSRITKARAAAALGGVK